MCQKATLKSEILSFKSQNNLVKHGVMSDFFFKNHSPLLRILQNRYGIRKYFRPFIKGSGVFESWKIVENLVTHSH